MKIAILGTRGIPNNYGGFEQFAEYVSVGLVTRGHEVTVYSPHFHSYKDSSFKGVKIKHIYCPEPHIGAAAHFVYDWLCLKHALKQNFDVIYEAGYHSNAPSYYLLKKGRRPVVITNMDGLEWKRSKWNYFTRKLIRYLEKLAVRKSDYLISDNVGIQHYYKDVFGADSFFIAYGADAVESYNRDCLKEFGVTRYSYYLLIARLEPENNIETVLDGYLLSGSENPFLVVGNHQSKYGQFLKRKYESASIRFMGSIYNKIFLDALREGALGYFHGHSVGGTNPSLLEAMASRSLIVAHNNEFNKSVLQENAFYFANPPEVAERIREMYLLTPEDRERMLTANLNTIKTDYSWSHIISQNEQLFRQLVKRKF